jgi:hypothetical protein
MENKQVLGIVLRGGLFEGSKLPEHYFAELSRFGRRQGYPRVAREVFRNVDSMIAARALYGPITAPVTLIYGDHDWSQTPEREANLSSLRGARSISLPETGHFAASSSPPASLRSFSTTTPPDVPHEQARSTRRDPGSSTRPRPISPDKPPEEQQRVLLAAHGDYILRGCPFPATKSPISSHRRSRRATELSYPCIDGPPSA